MKKHLRKDILLACSVIVLLMVVAVVAYCIDFNGALIAQSLGVNISSQSLESLQEYEKQRSWSTFMLTLLMSVISVCFGFLVARSVKTGKKKR